MSVLNYEPTEFEKMFRELRSIFGPDIYYDNEEQLIKFPADEGDQVNEILDHIYEKYPKSHCEVDEHDDGSFTILIDSGKPVLF